MNWKMALAGMGLVAVGACAGSTYTSDSSEHGITELESKLAQLNADVDELARNAAEQQKQERTAESGIRQAYEGDIQDYVRRHAEWALCNAQDAYGGFACGGMPRLTLDGY